MNRNQYNFTLNIRLFIPNSNMILILFNTTLDNRLTVNQLLNLLAAVPFNGVANV